MGKIITDPLLIILFALLGLQVGAWVGARWRAADHASRLARVWRFGVLGGTVILWLLATPMVAHLVLAPLERPFYDDAPLDAADIDAVVVLSGGLLEGPTAARDLLSGSSYARTDRGVQAFREVDAEYLVLAGGGEVARLAAQTAERLGVERERIVVEPQSSNTRAHPMEVHKLEEVTAGDRLAVVTSARHLPRALQEFGRHFAEVEGVPAEFITTREHSFIEQWLPQSWSLHRTTQGVHEHVGRLWYHVLAI